MSSGRGSSTPSRSSAAPGTSLKMNTRYTAMPRAATMNKKTKNTDHLLESGLARGVWRGRGEIRGVRAGGFDHVRNLLGFDAAPIHVPLRQPHHAVAHRGVPRSDGIVGASAPIERRIITRDSLPQITAHAFA